MKPERWKQIEELYHAAVCLTSASARPFSIKPAPGMRELRREIASLLGSEAQAGSFLAAPAAEAVAKVIAAEIDPSSYRAADRSLSDKSLLGAGGMGEVYSHRTHSCDASVAIKLLPAEFTADAGARVALRTGSAGGLRPQSSEHHHDS